MSSRRRKSKGFSLIELLVAVAILSIGIVVVLQALSFCARITGLSNDMVKAALLIKDKIQELEFKESKGLIANEPAVVNDKTDKYDWGYILNLDPDLNLFTLGFGVVWARSNRIEEIKLNTFLRQ